MLRRSLSTGLTAGVDFLAPTGSGASLTGIPHLLFTQTADKTVTASVVNTTETTLTAAGTGALLLPAGYFVEGRTLLIQAAGVFTTSATPVTLLHRFKLTGAGGATLCQTPAMNFTTAVLENKTNKLWRAWCTRLPAGQPTQFSRKAEWAITTTRRRLNTVSQRLALLPPPPPRLAR